MTGFRRLVARGKDCGNSHDIRDGAAEIFCSQPVDN